MKLTEVSEGSFTLYLCSMYISGTGSPQHGFYILYTEQDPSAIRSTPERSLGLTCRVAEHLLFLLSSSHGARTQQELSNSECQIGCVTSETSCGTERSNNGFDPGTRLGVSVCWKKKALMLWGEAGKWWEKCSTGTKKKMWCKLRQSSLQHSQWTPSGYIHGYICYALDLHMLTIPIYFFPSAEIAKPWY